MAIVFKGRKFSVEVEDVGFPNGRTHQKEIVRHVPSIVLIPFTDDGRILLCRQYRAPLAKTLPRTIVAPRPEAYTKPMTTSMRFFLLTVLGMALFLVLQYGPGNG